MLRHSREITRFNRERYIKRNKSLWWVRKSYWNKDLKEGYFNKFDIRPNITPLTTRSYPYEREVVKRETAQIIKDYNIR